MLFLSLVLFLHGCKSPLLVQAGQMSLGGSIQMEQLKGSWCSAAGTSQVQGRYGNMRTAPKVGPHPCLLWDRLISPGGSCVWADLSCSLGSIMQLEAESKLGSRAWSQAGSQSTRCIWIPGDKQDQFAKLPFLCLPGRRTLWTLKVYEGRSVFSLWLRFVIHTAIFWIGLIKTCWQPVEHQDPTELCDAGSTVQDV